MAIFLDFFHKKKTKIVSICTAFAFVYIFIYNAYIQFTATATNIVSFDAHKCQNNKRTRIESTRSAFERFAWMARCKRMCNDSI